MLASTTSVENSGLLAHLLPLFTAQTGITVRVLVLGSAPKGELNIWPCAATP